MTINLKPYPEYKDSGVEWLGKIPQHWQIFPNRALFVEVNERNHPDESLLSVTIGHGVIQQAALLANTSKKDSSNENKSNYKLVQPHDIAYNKMRAWQGAVGVSKYRGIVSPAYVVMRLRNSQNPWYFHYLYRTPMFAKEAERWSYGITSDMWSLRPEHFKMIYTTLPSLPEQSAIVRFINYFERRINRLIRAKQKMIGLLNEQKQAVINQYVTGKIDPRTGKHYPRYKPSGVEWLGNIPEHWEVKRLKAIARIRYGLGQPPRETLTGLPLIRATNVDNGKILENNLVRVDPADVPKTRNAFLKAGEIIVVRSGALTADSALIPKEYEGAVAGYDMVVTVKRASPEFIALALLSSYVQTDQLIIASMRAAQPHLNAEELGSAIIILPPDEEQNQIVEYVLNMSLPIKIATMRLEREIALLREYRTKLIADVVTGKLDVRGVELPAMEETDELEDLETSEDTEATEMNGPEGIANSDED
jgi:type I restriction enzyme S subunit